MIVILKFNHCSMCMSTCSYMLLSNVVIQTVVWYHGLDLVSKMSDYHYANGNGLHASTSWSEVAMGLAWTEFLSCT